MADAEKALGNDCFKKGEFDQAVVHFSNAIALDGSNHVLFSNRSAAYASQRKFTEAKADGSKAVELKPDWAKGYSRLGAACFGLRELDEAKEAYKKGLELDPANAQMKQGLQDVEKFAEASDNPIGKMFADPALIGKLATDPRTKGFLTQPDFIAMMQAVQANPSTINNYLQDPRMMQVLGVAMGVDVMSPDMASAKHSTPDEPPVPEKNPVPPEPEPEPEPLDPEEAARKEAKEKAQAAKQKGNGFYKAKQFAEAIEAYNEALSLDDTDISFLTNRAAVHFEMGNYAACIEDCDAAFEKGRELRADYKQLARALARKGTALRKSGDLEGAVRAYQKSLTEQRTADTLKKLQETEKELKLKKDTEYQDPVKAEEEREKGNTLFREQKFPEAVKAYTESIKRNPKDPRVWSNRAACYTKLTALPEALKDAEHAIELDPKFVKAYTRKGHAQFFMKEYEKALTTYQEGLAIEPQNEELKGAVQRCVDQINKANRGELSEEELKQRQAKAMQDPEIQTILSDPIMRSVLNDFQTDQVAAQKHMQNPGIMANIQKLVAAGIIQVK